MSSEQWCVRSGADAADWPQLPPSTLATAEALSDYAAAWLETAPAPLADVTAAAAEAAAAADADVPEMEVVSAVAMLNALLVSQPPNPPSASPAPEPSLRLSGAIVNMDAPLPIVLPAAAAAAADNSRSQVHALAAHLLRQSRWLATGLSHAGGGAAAAVPRLPSARLLGYVCQHALTDSASPPSQPVGDVVTPTAAAAAPPSFRGCLVLLLFHAHPSVRLWARDALLRLVAGAPSAAAEADFSSPLLRFALELLCSLKHILPICEMLSFSETRPDTAAAAAAGVVVVVSQARVQTAVSGLFHVLTVLAAWEGRYATAVGAASANSTPDLLSLLSRCRTTVVLLGGRLLLHGLQSVHRGVTSAVAAAAMASPVVRRGASMSGGGAAVDAARVSAVALRRVTQTLNELLAVNPRMPKSVAVTASTLTKTMIKVLVHCLLDTAAGLPSSREEEGWRRGRLQWLWAVAAQMEPPTTRVAAPLTAATSTTTATAESLAASVPVPEKTAGWLLKPLLKNAEQHFQWAAAMETAKGRPTDGAGSAAALTVLDRAVFGLHLLLDTLCAALPALMRTRYLHDVLAAYESQLLTLAIGGIVHTRTAHALRLHRLLFAVDVRAFSAGAAAEAAATTTVDAASPFHSVPVVCMQRVWLTLPTLLTQVCRAPLSAGVVESCSSSSSSNGGSSVCPRLPLPHVLAALCGTLTTLVEPAAEVAPCARWLLLSSATAMGDAPPPFQWVVQRCLKTLTEALRDHHDVLLRAWLGGTAANTGGGGAAMKAAAHMLTEERDLLRLVHALPCAAAEDGGMRRLGEQLAALFCTGVSPAVARGMAAEAAEAVWRNVVLPQPALALLPTASSPPTAAAAAAAAASSVWDLTSAAVANTARAQGRHWLLLLPHCSWLQRDAWTVRCGWWMAALVADVVVLDGEQRRALAEDVVLALPTAAMRDVSSNLPRLTEGGSDGADMPAVRSTEAVQEAQRVREEASRLCAVVQRLFLSLLRKAETYPRASLDRVLCHVANAISPAHVRRDGAFHKAVQPLLVRLCPRRPEVQAALTATTVGAAAPAWLQQWTADAAQSVTACLADQERRFAQYELEEDALKREQADAARTAATEAQVRRTNAAKRTAELDAERRARAAEDGSAGSSSAVSAVVTGAPSSSSSSSLTLQFPDRPLLSEDVQQTNGGGVKRPRSASPPAVIDVTASDSDSDEGLALPPGLPRAPLVPQDPQQQPQPQQHQQQQQPTKLQQKLQALNARSTHRVHHAEQLRRLQDRLCRVAAGTNLVRLQPPLTNDIIGDGSQCMAPVVPVLPDVFVSAAEAATVMGGAAATATGGGGGGGAVSMPFGDAASAYGERFAPHIALELRCDIVRNYEDLLEGVARWGPPPQQQQQNRSGDVKGVDGRVPDPGSAPLSWTQLLPLHPGIPASCFAVQNTGTSAPASGNAHDPLSFRFSVRACANPAVIAAQRVVRAGGNVPPGDVRAIDPAVRCVADQGLSAGLSEGDVVAVLLPLHVVGAAWVERQIGAALPSLPPEEQQSRVEAVIASLPHSWRLLGCVPQVCYVQSLHPGERAALLCGYPPTEAPAAHHHHHQHHISASTAAASTPPLRFQHALRMAFHTAQNTFYVRKLTSLNSFHMELAALHRIDHTRFAATLYDPRHVAPLNAVYYDWITRLLTTAHHHHNHNQQQQQQQQQPLLTQLRRRLLLQRHLNDWQIRAIVAVLYASCFDWDDGEARQLLGTPTPHSPEVLLIEGPPGTGKTQTIGSLTLNVLHHLSRTRGANARVLVCAPSNCAVDEALLRVVHLRERLVQETSSGGVGGGGGDAGSSDSVTTRPTYNVLSGGILRVGMKDRVDPEVLRLPQPVFFDDVVEQRLSGGEAGAHRGGGALMSARNAVRASTLESASIVFSTLGSLHHVSRQVQGLTFDVVIVDEASQGTEPAVLQALVLARHKCVLVGDSKQLQPTILSTEASRAGLRRSLLVRLLACGHRSFLLRTQYRMHPDICAFPNAYFYAGKLETDRSVRQRSRTSSRAAGGLLSDSTTAGACDPSVRTVAQRLGRCPRFVFVDVPQSTMERRRGKSLFNREEARAVVQVMRQLRTLLQLSVMEMAPQLGIITFYNAQKDVILSCLTPEERRSGLQVASVDSFQGKEKRIILLSCVRTAKGDTSDPGFLAYWNRLNVALTRAKDLLVVVGSAHFLRSMGGGRGYDDIGSIPSERHRLTTLRSTDAEVVQQLEAHDRNPLALFGMFCHAESCEAVYTYGVKESTRRLQ